MFDPAASKSFREKGPWNGEQKACFIPTPKFKSAIWTGFVTV